MSKKKRAEQVAANQKQIRDLVLNPRKYMSFHEDYNAMLNLCLMLVQTTDDMEEAAHCIFYGNSSKYRAYARASYAVLETIRKDDVLFPEYKTEEGLQEYEHTLVIANRMRSLFKLILCILNASGDEGYIQIESALKLIYTRDKERYNISDAAYGILSAHRDDLEVRRVWESFVQKEIGS